MKMKKIFRKGIFIFGLLVIALEFTACGDMDVSGADLEGKERKEKEIEEEKVEGKENEEKITEQEVENEDQEKEENKEEIIQNQEEDKKSNIVLYQHKDIFMSIELPLEWDYKVHTVKEMEKQDGLKLCSIEFWLKEKPEVKLEFAYWPMIGLCGTGLTTEEVTFENGLSAEKNTEESEDSIWFMLIYQLDREEGYFAVDANLDKKLWKEYEEDIMKVLGTACFTEIGINAEMKK